MNDTVGPLSAVLQAFEDGAPSMADVSRRTGLSAELLSAAVGHLVRIGRLSTEQLVASCPTGDCRSCASAASGTAACGGGARRTPGGPVLVSLTPVPTPTRT